MTNLLKRDSDIWSVIRATPLVYFFYILINGIIHPNFNNIYFLIAYCIIFIVNGLLKLSFKQIYKLFKTDYIPFIGQGSRPKNCTNSGTFLKLNKPISTTFGMPSGHSQLAWFFSSYIILNILQSNKFNIHSFKFDKAFKHENLSKYKYMWFKIIFLIIFALVVNFSRIYVENCHTLGQVIIGSIIGIISGIITFYIKDLLMNKYKYK